MLIICCFEYKIISTKLKSYTGTASLANTDRLVHSQHSHIKICKRENRILISSYDRVVTKMDPEREKKTCQFMRAVLTLLTGIEFK